MQGCDMSVWLWDKRAGFSLYACVSSFGLYACVFQFV